jgi:lipoic acid synthetase
VEKGVPAGPDPNEPARLAEAARRLALRHVVITSVTRDDLEDGGARHFDLTIRAVRTLLPSAAIEVLTPDFNGSRESIETVCRARPDVFSHNIETVRRLTGEVRSGADYERSLGLLRWVGRNHPEVRTKSGLMVGLGETESEIHEALEDLREAGVRMVTIGQYLKPAPGRLEVSRYVPPDLFQKYKGLAEALGFEEAAAGPFVRSSYRAEELFQNIRTFDINSVSQGFIPRESR